MCNKAADWFICGSVVPTMGGYCCFYDVIENKVFDLGLKITQTKLETNYVKKYVIQKKKNKKKP